MSIKGARGLLRYQTVMIENSAFPTWRGVGEPYWSRPAIEMLQECRSRPTGLTSTEARNGLSRHGPNTFAGHRREQALAVLLRQFCNPLVLIRIVAVIVSCVVGEGREAVIIGAIILASCGLGFSQEYSASRAVDALKQGITIAYALVSEWSKRLFFEHDRHHPGPRRRARHGRATVRGLIEDARSAAHRQGALPLSAGPELEATEAHRR
jgi:cation transport ATPase-like protein